MNMESIEILRKYTNYAVIGVTTDHEKYGYKVYKKLQEIGKKVYGISPIYQEIEGQKVYKSLMDIEPPVDVVVFVVNKKYGMDYIKELRGLGIKYAWMQPGTYDDDLLDAFHEQGIDTILDCVLVRSKNL